MNIILLMSDSFRYDNLFDRAAMPVRTPCLDKFSKRAVSFSNFYAASLPTIPQRTDMISGRVGWPWYPWQDLVKSTANCLPRLLADNGYATQLLCDCPHLFNSGFQKAFHAAEAMRGQEADMPFLRMNHEIKEAMPREKTREGHHFLGNTLINMHKWTNRNWRLEEDRFAPRTARRTIEWLEENYQHSPFFLWVDFFDPHEPWDPPEYMVSKYNPDYSGPPMLHPNYGLASDYTEAELRNLRAHYCAEAEMVDRWVGRVLQKIDDLALWDDTIVIFTSDHGISLGEHNRTGKTNINENDDRIWPLYPEIAHVPFLIHAPGIKGGTTVDALAQPQDIVPTLTDLAGRKCDMPEDVHGMSLAPLLRGEKADPERDFVIAGRHLRLDEGKIADCATTSVVYTSEWAYAPVGADRKPELYDLKADPLGENNIIADNPGVAEELSKKLFAFLEEMNAPEEASAPYRISR